MHENFAHQPISVRLTSSTISRLARLLVNGDPRLSSKRNLYTSHWRFDVECLPISACKNPEKVFKGRTPFHQAINDKNVQKEIPFK
ncbi:hypothetical protein Hanom_Chr07g00671311 [Helianthus anomalus]